MHVQLALTPRKTLRFLLACVGCLTAAYAATLVLRFGFGHDHVLGLPRLFDLDQEQNLPSLFSTLQLLACAVLLGAAAVDAQQRGRAAGKAAALHWAGLAAGFVLMAVDEFVSLHELFTAPVAAATHATGAFANAWVIPYGALVLVIGVAYARFVFHLPRAIGARFAVAGTLYVCSALGIEMLEGALAQAVAGAPGPWLVLATTAQEVAEMTCISYFLATLVRYFEAAGAPLRVQITNVAAPSVLERLPVVIPSFAAGGRQRRAARPASGATARAARRGGPTATQ